MFRSAVQSARIFIGDERGEFNIKGLAITVATIVVIGAVVTWLTEGNQMTTWITEVWGSLGVWLEDKI